MKTFKQFKELLEVLTQAQKDEVDNWPKGRNSFSDRAFNDPEDQRVSIPLEQPDTPSEHRKAVEDHLGEHGYTIKDYNAGKTTDKYGREVNIGRALGNTKASKDLINRFANDPARQQKKTSAAGNDIHVSITRHPHDVAGMTSCGQSWEEESCMNFRTGDNRKYLPKDVLHGTHVAYLTDKEDKENARPLARIALKAYYNVDDPEDKILRTEDRTYGAAPGAFAHTVNKWTQENFPARRDGIYKKHPDVYDDTNQPYYMHKEAIDKALGHHDVEVRKAAASHPEINEDQLNRALDDDNSEVRESAARNRNATKANLDKAFTDYSESGHMVRSAAAGNLNATREHIDTGLKDKHKLVRRIAARNPNSNEDQINKALKDESWEVRERAAMNKSATENNLNNALDQHGEYGHMVRIAAANNASATENNINKALKDKNVFVRAAAAANKNATEFHLDQALNDHGDGSISKDNNSHLIRAAAVRNGNALERHIDKALGDKHSRVRAAAAANHKATEKQIHRALQDHDVDVASEAASNMSATSANLHTALNDDMHVNVRAAAASNRNATREHLERALNDDNLEVREAARDNSNYNKHFN